MSAKPDTAVVIPVGSVDDMLGRQIRSVLVQDLDSPFEIVLSINKLLEVSWATLPQRSVHVTEVELIREHMPLLNLQSYPRGLCELSALRLLCRNIASGSVPAS